MILVLIDITMSGMFVHCLKMSYEYLILENHSNVESQISQPKAGFVYLPCVCWCSPCL